MDFLARRQALVLALVSALSLSGCASKGPDWRSAWDEGQGPVEWNYSSPQDLPTAAVSTPARLRVLDFESAPPSGGTGAVVGQAFIAMWPLVGALTPAATFQNRIDAAKRGHFGWDLQDHEIEAIVASELRKVGLFDSVQVGGPHASLDLGGRFDCQKRTRAHLSGLGFLYLTLIVPMFALPVGSEWYECEAYFTIRNDSQELFSESYESRFGGQRWLSSDEEESVGAFGKHVAPEIIKHFVDDLLALDPSLWTSGVTDP